MAALFVSGRGGIRVARSVVPTEVGAIPRSAHLFLVGGTQLLDNLFGGVSLFLHDESQTRLAPGTLITDGSIFGEHAIC